MKEVYVLHVSSDVNYELPGVWESGAEAEAAAVAYVQDMRKSKGFDKNPHVPVVETYADIAKWNEYWDTEPDMQVQLIVVPFFRKGEKIYRLLVDVDEPDSGPPMKAGMLVRLLEDFNDCSLIETLNPHFDPGDGSGDGSTEYSVARVERKHIEEET